MREARIKDNFGRNYLVKDINKFKDHITKYHSHNNNGDGSLHIENGRYFTISKEFYQTLMKL